MTLSRSVPFDVRLWSRVEKLESGCWIWQGPKNKKGYGSLCRNGKKVQAHRAAWEMKNGPIPPGMFICHHCDTPSCVNESHLFLGTAQDNTLDCIQKGRWHHNGKVGKPGEQTHNAKLTASQVLAIRHRATAEPIKHIAASYGLSYFTVYDVVNGRTWKHVA